MKSGRFTPEENAAVDALLARPRYYGDIKALAAQLERRPDSVYQKMIARAQRAKRAVPPMGPGPRPYPACDAMVDDGPLTYAQRFERILRETANA